MIPPYADDLAKHFCPPIFVDGAFTSDRETSIYAAIAATTNAVILIGLAMCNPESVEYTYTLLRKHCRVHHPNIYIWWRKGIIGGFEN